MANNRSGSRANLIHVPVPLSVLAHLESAPHSGLAGEDWPKSIDSKLQALLEDIETTLLKKVFNSAH